LTTEAQILSPSPVRTGSWAVSATPERPLALLVRRQRELLSSLHAVTIENPDGVEVPIDPESTGLLVDAHGESVRLLTSTVRDGVYARRMLLSRDLAEWTEIELSLAPDRPLSAFGGGLVASSAARGAVVIWEIADDGTVTQRGSIPVGDGERIDVEAVNRVGETIVVAATVRTEDPDGIGVTFASTDGGSTWSEPTALPIAGSAPNLMELRAVPGGLLLLGEQELDPEWNSGPRTYTSSAAWFSPDGITFAQEHIPLPTFGKDGWSSRVRGELDADTPIDFRNVETGGTVSGAEGAELTTLVAVGDDPRTATRAQDGAWSTSGLGWIAPGTILGGVVGPEGRILRLRDGVHVHRAEEAESTAGLRYSGGRSLRLKAVPAPGQVDGLLPWSDRVTERTEESLSWYAESAVIAFQVVEERLTTATIPPTEVPQWTDPSVHALTDATLLTGRHADEETGEYELGMRIVVDGAGWEVPTVPELSTVTDIGDVVRTEDAYLLPVAVEPDDDRLEQPVVLSSTDGMTWEQLGTVIFGEDPLSHGGGRINAVVPVGDTLVGVGSVWDAEGEGHAATFVRTGDEWISHIIEGAPAQSFLSWATVVGGDVLVQGEADGRTIHAVLAADGTLTETYRSTDTEERDLPLDLGEGALIATGSITRSSIDVEEHAETGFGSCLWASLDGGATWNATMIPEHKGRYPALALQQDGDDVLVVVSDADGPRAFRVVQAQQSILAHGETEE
jgi:hypothetical protein